MSPLEQEKLLEQTRAQIRQNVAEIAELARTTRNGVQFFRDFLSRVVRSLNAQGGAVWLPGAGGEFQPIAEESLASSAYHENERQRRDIHRVLAEVVKTKRPFIVGAVSPDLAPSSAALTADEEIMNTTPYPMFFTPVFVGEEQAQIGAVLHVWLPSAGDPKSYPSLSTFLTSVCVHAGNFLKARQGEAAMARNQEYENMLRFVGDFVGELEPKKVGRTAVNHFTDLFQANRCSLFHQVGGRWRLEYVSNQETIDQRSELVVDLCKIAARLPVTDAPTTLSLDVAEQADVWREPFEAIGAQQVAYAFYQPHVHEGQTALILLERHSKGAPFNQVGLRQLGWARQQLSRASLAASTYREVPFRRVLHPVTRARGLWRARRRARLAAFIGIPLLLLALWLLVPWTLRVEGDCVVQPQHQATVSAETPGKIERVLVQEGQTVEAGAVVAKLEDDDLRTQMAVAIQDTNKWQSEANRYQSTGDDAQRRLAEINLDGSRAKMVRLKYLQSRTELRSPISGVVLTKNLANRLGENLEVGKVFCEIGGRDNYEVVVNVNQQDLGVLTEALKQRGKLPVDFILHAHTDTRLHTTIEGMNSISETARTRPGSSYFEVRADFPVNSSLVGALKPGYTGKAKVDLGRHPLAAVMLRKFFDYWRVEWSL